MTGSAPGERAEAERSAVARLRDAAVPLGILLVLGFALRLIIAYGLLPGSGLGFDVGSFNSWASNLASQGPWGIYDRGFFLDYTPGYLYVLWVLGGFAHLLAGADAVPGELLKVPPMLADLGLAVGAFLLVADLGGSRRRALIAAALVLLVPVTWIDSSIWSQVDSVGTLVLVFAVWRLGRGDHVGGTVLTTLAAIIKPQFGILIPLAAVLIIRRDFEPRERRWWADDPVTWAIRIIGLVCIALSVIPGLGAIGPVIGIGATAVAVVLWLRDRELGFGLGRLTSIVLVGLGTAQAVCLPFGINVLRLATNIVQTGNGYPYVTVNAYNPWALVVSGDQGLALNGSWIPDITTSEHGQGLAILGIPAVVVGTLLLLAAIGVLAAVLWRRPDRRTLVVTLAVMSIAFFVLPTRVHERYMFPFFVLGAVLAAGSVRWSAVYTVLATGVTMNLLGVLAVYRGSTTGLDPFFNMFGGFGLRLTDWIRSDTGVALAATLSAGGLIAAAVFLARPTPEEEDWERGLADAVNEESVRGPVAGAVAAAGRTAARGASGAGAWLRRPHFDRSALLAGEGGGRLDRLDLWLIVVIVAASLVLRTFRLAEPYQMHFDEVYHARTAAEFLQDWRYGKPHDIYEYTHPHLAKYAIAGGLVAFGNDRVETTSNLGTGVRDALVEPRWDDEAVAAGDGTVATAARRGGERVYVATGSELRIYDLVSRAQLAAIPAPGATALAIDIPGRRVFVGTEAGQILAIATDMSSVELKAAASAGTLGLAPFATASGPIARLWAIGGDPTLIASLQDGTLASYDASGPTGALIASGPFPGVHDVLDAGTFPALVADPGAVTDVVAEAKTLAGILGGSTAQYESLLRSTASRVTLRSQLGSFRPSIDSAVAAGTLTGISVNDVTRLAVADDQGVSFVDPTAIRVTGSIPLAGGATSLTSVGNLDSGSLYAANGASLATITLPKTDADPATLSASVWMPGAISKVTYDPATGLAHALGRTPDGTGWTVYVIEPRGNSVFADARLPFEPVAWANDVNEKYPATDREQLLVFAADGSSAAVSIGQNAFAWRLPGVIAGALMAGLLFLLARILFRRRSIAVLAGIFGLIDGMFLVQQRIAMNDSYVALFIVAAMTMFAAIWTGALKSRLAFWLGMPIVGVLLGLALASKWVALYVIGAIGVLILIRSALGRVVVILGLAAGTGVLGWMAAAVPEGATSGGNLAFVVIMLALTVIAAVAAVLHPIAWTPEEVRIAVGGPVAAGAAIGLLALPLKLTPVGFYLALACFGAGGLAMVGFWVGGRIGLGPMAPPPSDDDPAAILPPPSPAPDGWLRPGWALGVPIAWAVASVLVIPVIVYVISYLPWVALGNRLTTSWPPGHTGQTLLDLTKSMYDYHNNLRATHAASSPWWAWPLDLKPVWFYQGSMAGGESGAIYDGGNIALWWVSIPAMAFVAFQAFRRRSNALGLIAVTVACTWLAWARIDRATFEYHYYSTLPFVLLGLAYFIAEIWHGPSSRTWLLARGAAVAALLAPVVLWFGRGPLCAIAGVERVNPNSQACTSAAAVSITPSLQVLGLIAVLVLGGGLVVWQMLRLDRAIREGAGPEETRPAARLAIITAAVSVLALGLAWLVLPTTPLFTGTTIPGEVMALVLLLILGPLAWIAATARSPRRFVVGFVAAAVVVFVAFYPNWSGLPLPEAVFNYYQGLLPTWIYAFQFAVNMNEPFSVSFHVWYPYGFAAIALVVAAFLAYVAWTWQIALAERRADEAAFDPEP